MTPCTDQDETCRVGFSQGVNDPFSRHLQENHLNLGFLTMVTLLSLPVSNSRTNIEISVYNCFTLYCGFFIKVFRLISLCYWKLKSYHFLYIL